MPPNQKPVKVAPTTLPIAPTWDELKADPQFLDWHKSPFLRLMTAALRASSPISGAADPHAMIRDGGVAQGWMIALHSVDDFCKTQDQLKDKPKRQAYAPTKSED